MSGRAALLKKRERALETNDRKSDQKRPGIAAHELADFRMQFDDGARPAGMRMTQLRVIERLLHEKITARLL